MKIGINLKKIRHEAGLTQFELATKSGVQPLSISRIETSNANPALETLLKLSKALNVSLDDLVYGPRQSPQEVA